MSEEETDEEAQAHLAQGEEEEQSLLMAHSVVLNPRPFLTVAPALPPPCHAVHISEQKVFVDLG
jgi:hypothetical protein